MSLIDWQQQGNILLLNGILDRQTVALIWGQRIALFKQISAVNVASLSRVDSAGLALLVYCCLHFKLKLVGVSEQLNTLIKLYNLEKVIE
ncbi:hypothetical protein RHO15_10375 [Utexia brackfieldae]|uniref:anti-sigma B factor antagonist n=1 Tax=Utexia brackfieldae TaxID=3074108 RepID=UPI00370DA9E6